MKFKIMAAFAVVILGAAGFAAATVSPAKAMQELVNTIASPQKANDVCPAPFTNGYTCTFEPATVTTTSHTKVVVKKTVKEQVKQFETVNNVIASINEGPPTSGAGCIDPTSIAAWGFHAGNSFYNTDTYHRRFLDTWEQGWEVCGWHIEKTDGQYWLVGTKANCRNRNIMIPVRHKLPKPTKRVLTFTSVKSFESTYERWATSTTSTLYTCNAPFTLTYVNGNAICFIATQVPMTTPTTTTVPTTVTVPTTQTTTTTVTVPSPEIRLEQIQELYPNESQPICADLKNVPSGGGSVKFSVQAGSAPKGSFADASESASSGNSRVCDTFTAPDTTGTNQYTADLWVGGNKVATDSLYVEIVPQPTNP